VALVPPGVTTVTCTGVGAGAGGGGGVTEVDEMTVNPVPGPPEVDCGGPVKLVPVTVTDVRR